MLPTVWGRHLCEGSTQWMYIVIYMCVCVCVGGAVCVVLSKFNKSGVGLTEHI